MFECLTDFDELASGVIGAEIDGCTDGDCAHIPCLFNLSEHHLVSLVGVGEEFVMVDFDHERDFVRVFAADHSEHAEGGANHVASTFDSEFDDSGGVEADGVFGE